MAEKSDAANPASYGPAKTALLLLDYHEQYVERIQPEEQKRRVLHAVELLLQAARSSGARIAHCVIDIHNEPLRTSKIRSQWEADLKHMIASSPEKFKEWQSIAAPPDSNSSESNEMTTTKRLGCISALKSPELLLVLKDEWNVESLVICGLTTSGAVLSTAREATDLGFVTTVVTDGCWDSSKERHDVVLDSILPVTTWIVNIGTAKSLLRGNSADLK